MISFRSQLLLIIVLVLCVVDGVFSYTIESKIFYSKIAKSNLICTGVVTDHKLILRTETDQVGRLIPVEPIARLSTIKVEQVLFGKDKFKSVSVIQKIPDSRMDAGLLTDRMALFFLKKAKIDSNLHEIDSKFSKALDKSKTYYEVVFGAQGEYRLANKDNRPDKKNLEYARITEAFCKTKSLKNMKVRESEWSKLLNDPNPILRESVEIELKRIELMKKRKERSK